MSHRIGHEMFGSARSAWGGMILAASLPWAALPLVAHAQETKVVVAQSADVPTLDPTATTSSLGNNVYQNVFDHLTTIAADGSVTPRLGEKWDIADKAKVWTFKIRNGVKFHDGSPLTVDDVIWTYQKVMADANPSSRSTARCRWFRSCRKRHTNGSARKNSRCSRSAAAHSRLCSG